MHLFPAPQSAQWWLEIGHGRNIYTTEIGKAISQVFFLLDCWLLNTSQHTAVPTFNSSHMLGFPSCFCMPHGHTRNLENWKASLRRGVLLCLFFKFLPSLAHTYMAFTLLFARPCSNHYMCKVSHPYEEGAIILDEETEAQREEVACLRSHSK